MKPILFNSEMIRAILSGRKTVTRRLVKPQPKEVKSVYDLEPGDTCFHCGKLCRLKEPRNARKYAGELIATPIELYRPGDILYVREAWKRVCATEYSYENGSLISSEELFGYKYRANNEITWDERKPRSNEFFFSEITEEFVWHPSIHMPKEAARIFLRVKDVRVERLMAISDDGVKAEGANFGIGVVEQMRQTAAKHFAEIWDSTIKKQDLNIYGWDANPWVFVIEFERCEKPEAIINYKYI